ncbi:MAG: D-glycero-beta-D-manno-heptose 1-phosphate adenylyltransferase [Candidatus Sumerlaeaceae bacterium]|nr:D-glycero-beta-D-manno-heptose 1-phosphate adenylyltransferase [Candidatus Sumerlaeaceae bacterium]
MTVCYRFESDIPEITPWEELGKILDELRRAGKTIVFTNGVFDLIHPGHVRYLRQARSLGDALVVALNSDASVKRVKGPQRPILPLAERARILGMFEMVDYLTAFEEETPVEVIKALRPSVLVKGGDYTPDQVVGKDFVESCGGSCVTVGFAEGFSTTAIVQRIVEMSRKAAR